MEDKVVQLSRNLRRSADKLEALGQTRLDLASLQALDHPAYHRYDSIKQRLFVASLRIDTVCALIEMGEEVEDKYLAQAEALTQEARTELSALVYECWSNPGEV